MNLLATRAIQIRRAVDYRAELVERATPTHAFTEGVDLVAHHPQVMHLSRRGDAWQKGAEAAVGIRSKL